MLETTRREELGKDEAKRAARKAARQDNGPLLEESDELVVDSEPVEVTVSEVVAAANEDEEEEDDDRPDLLLRESARIVRDMIELGSDEPTLARQFSLLDKDKTPESLN